MSEDAAILGALCQHFEDLVTGATNIDKVMPSIEKYQPNVKRPYISSRFMPMPTKTPFIGVNSAAVFEGEFRLVVHMPSKHGEETARELAARIACHFRRGTALDACGFTVRIKHRPSQAPAIVTADRISIPVSVRYFASRSYKGIKT